MGDAPKRASVGLRAQRMKHEHRAQSITEAQKKVTTRSYGTVLVSSMNLGIPAFQTFYLALISYFL
jgi:hypothetical protein